MMPQEELSGVVAQPVVFSGCLKRLEGKENLFALSNAAVPGRGAMDTAHMRADTTVRTVSLFSKRY